MSKVKNNKHYQSSISVNASSSDVYKALTTGFEYWWTKPDNLFVNKGDRAKFTFPPGKSFWTFEVKVLIPNQRVEMVCIQALHLHEGQPKAIEQEWLGSTVLFNIVAKGGFTYVHMEHVGLTNDLLCYQVCEAGWNFFFKQSLKTYLDTGIGMPHHV